MARPFGSCAPDEPRSRPRGGHRCKLRWSLGGKASYGGSPTSRRHGWLAGWQALRTGRACAYADAGDGRRPLSACGFLRDPANSHAVLALDLLERQLERGERLLVRGDPAALDRVAPQRRRAQLASIRASAPSSTATRDGRLERAPVRARRPTSSAAPAARTDRRPEAPSTCASTGQATPRMVRQRTVTSAGSEPRRASSTCRSPPSTAARVSHRSASRAAPLPIAPRRVDAPGSSRAARAAARAASRRAARRRGARPRAGARARGGPARPGGWRTFTRAPR